MRYLVTGEQMKAIDRHAVQAAGIPSVVLMERAALAVADAVEELAGGPAQTPGAGAGSNLYVRPPHILSVCGTGNNGADGIAAGRILHNKGYQVTILLAGDPERGTAEYQLQKSIAINLGMQVVKWKDFLPGRCDILIDAVFGVGLSRPVEGEYKEVLQMMADAGAGCVVAVDMPSGIHSDSGQIMGTALRADVTVTFGWQKLGSALYPGRDFCGQVRVCDIGFPAAWLPAETEAGGSMAVMLEPEDLKRIPPRPADSHKGSFGKVLVVAGSENMSGAAYFSALSAYRTGAGLVKVMSDEKNRVIMQELLPEAILTTYTSDEMEEEPESFSRKVENECAWADVIVLGPGIGRGPGVYELMRAFLVNAYVPMIIDADGLNAVAQYPELSQYLTENVIMTPHVGEMARLTGLTADQIGSDPAAVAAEYSAEHGITCVLKDAATVICGRDGQICVNGSGNSCMAKAGSGDVLTGVIAGLIAQGCEVWDAAALGVYLHGLAGDRICARDGSYAMLARELADEVGQVLAQAGK